MVDALIRGTTYALFIAWCWFTSGPDADVDRRARARTDSAAPLTSRRPYSRARRSDARRLVHPDLRDHRRGTPLTPRSTASHRDPRTVRIRADPMYLAQAWPSQALHCTISRRHCSCTSFVFLALSTWRLCGLRSRTFDERSRGLRRVLREVGRWWPRIRPRDPDPRPGRSWSRHPEPAEEDDAVNAKVPRSAKHQIRLILFATFACFAFNVVVRW